MGEDTERGYDTSVEAVGRLLPKLKSACFTDLSKQVDGPGGLGTGPLSSVT